MQIDHGATYRIISAHPSGFQLKTNIHLDSKGDGEVFAGPQLPDDDPMRAKQWWQIVAGVNKTGAIYNKCFGNGKVGPVMTSLKLDGEHDGDGDYRAYVTGNSVNNLQQAEWSIVPATDYPGGEGVRLINVLHKVPLKISVSAPVDGDYPLYGGWGGNDTEPLRFIFLLKKLDGTP